MIIFWVGVGIGVRVGVSVGLGAGDDDVEAVNIDVGAFVDVEVLACPKHVFMLMFGMYVRV